MERRARAHRRRGRRESLRRRRDAFDVHLGASLPGEDLVGARPSPSDDDDDTETDAFDPIDAITTPRRAYVFNVCVAPNSEVSASPSGFSPARTDICATTPTSSPRTPTSRYATRRASRLRKASYVVNAEQSFDDVDAPRALLYRPVRRPRRPSP